MKKIVLGIVILGLMIRGGRVWRYCAVTAEQAAPPAAPMPPAAPQEGKAASGAGTRRTLRPATPNG